ncbi:hypothetical protein KVR01_003862 [Diaporthe batatas]|uniref:uncharacterized protein n=1 Tax=Diaporthe batatas TaxID=748121 RepID=UPI001D045515|nr:uncharacterized protein KVR01_003862 [Diaporthe batatas]KAG8168173.1 hypothetical protein KVR01_003862 [Diaporthe batatas]
MVSFLSWLFSGKRQQCRQPGRVVTDTVVKLATLENSLMMRSMCMNWTFRFEHALDVAMLQKSLEDLISKGHNWRKLGGRFRVNTEGQLELHIPEEFCLKRPAVQFTDEVHATSVHEHVLDGTLPGTEDRPCVLDTPEALDVLLAGPDAPKSLDDWLYSDRPALAVHVITFTDATFVTLSYSHCLVDGVGKREIMTNWCKVLAGRTDDVTPLADWDEDPLSIMCRSPSEHEERYVHAEDRLTGWHKWYWVLRFIADRFSNRNHYRQRNVFIPASTMKRLRQEAADHPVTNKARLSDNQLLTAWLTRLACSPLKGSNRPIGITSAVDLRGFPLPGLRPGTVYLQNLLAYTWINTTEESLLRSPLGTAVNLMRTSLKRQLTLPQVQIAAYLTHDAVGRTGTPDFFTGKDSFMVSVSSLAKAKYWEAVDFSPAILKSGNRDENAGRPTWQSSTPRSGMKPSCLVVVQGSDLKGNWFAQMVLSQRAWMIVEHELSKW